MNTFLQISSLCYVFYIFILFFSKKKVKTLENRIYGFMLVQTLVIILLDILSRKYALMFPITNISEIIYKLNIGVITTYPLIFSSYVFYITSDKYI